jgi:hypothetical protein
MKREVALGMDGTGAEGVAVTSPSHDHHHPIHHCPGSGYVLSATLQILFVLESWGRMWMRQIAMFPTQLEHQDLTPWKREPPELD